MKKMNLGDHINLKKKVYRWNDKLIVKVIHDRYVEKKTMENWFKYRFPGKKVLRWLKSRLKENEKLIGTVELHRYKSSNRCFCLQYDMTE